MIQISIFLTLAIFIMVSVAAMAQQTYMLTAVQEIKVAGTSTLHDWEMVSAKAEGKVLITARNNQITSISSLVVTLPATSLKSGKKAMDEIAYESLRAKQQPEIHFVLDQVESITDELIMAKGRLTIAATSHAIPVEVNYKVTGDAIRFTGSLPLTFTQFKIDPPKAMFGTIKTGDELKIFFDITFNSINQNSDNYEND